MAAEVLGAAAAFAPFAGSVVMAPLAFVYAATEELQEAWLPRIATGEVRFGVGSSTLAAIVTSNTATGSYNSMHDSYSSLGGMVLLVNMLLGELIFGGLGSGLYSMVMATAIAVFLAGLMVGRTPEYLGKKIGPPENKMIVLYALAAPLFILPLTAIAISTSAGLSGLTVNSGPHGFTGILFAYTSCFANNGQTFGGFNANTVFYNLTTAVAMLAGRFGLAVAAGMATRVEKGA